MPVIAIDGPAASGKGTLGKRVAQHFGFHHLDTGLLYRGVAFHVTDVDDHAQAIKIAQNFKQEWLDEPGLRGEEIGRRASQISVLPELRTALLDYQRRFANQAPGAVLDGRDIGSVICPNAEIKLFITADVEIRASRRLKELRERDETIIYAAVLKDLIERDRRDRDRAVAPMMAATGAFLLDTSRLDADQTFTAALAFIEPRLG